jgi:hypothetical protein
VEQDWSDFRGVKEELPIKMPGWSIRLPGKYEFPWCGTAVAKTRWRRQRSVVNLWHYEQAAQDMVVALPLARPARVFCDNQGVVKNVSIPESVLTKKQMQ